MKPNYKELKIKDIKEALQWYGEDNPFKRHQAKHIIDKILAIAKGLRYQNECNR